MRHFLTACLLLLASVTGALAQSYDSGSEVTRDWPDGDLNETWGGPPIATGAAHPADTYEPAIYDENGYTRSLWLSSSTSRYRVNGAEDKQRLTCKPAFIKRADPILARGQYPALHDHTFFGANNAYVIANVENFDYQMGRDYPGSSCQGGPLNTTLYWESSVKDDRYDVSLTVMPSDVNFYYQNLAHGDGAYTTRLRRNFRFIAGAVPSDFNDTARRAEYSAANLDYPGTTTEPAGFGGIGCYPTALGGNTAATVVSPHGLGGSTAVARYTKGPNGEDPWNGACTAGEIIIIVDAQECWDGTNLSSPNGRSHVAYSTRDGDNAPPAGTCPQNYVKVPVFVTKTHYAHNGWTQDVQHWYKSSDRMRVATTECPDETEPCDGVSGGNVPATVGGVYYSRVSLDPCRASGLDFCNMATSHFDWWGSWDDTIMTIWERNCLGMTVYGTGGNSADCGTGSLTGCTSDCGPESVAAGTSLLASGTPPEAGLSTNPVNSLPTERAGTSTEFQRYFPVRPEDLSQPALNVDNHPVHN